MVSSVPVRLLLDTSSTDTLASSFAGKLTVGHQGLLLQSSSGLCLGDVSHRSNEGICVPHKGANSRIVPTVQGSAT